MQEGSKLEFKYVVQSMDLAKELSIDMQDDFPEVLATSRMIALMELAAARLMHQLLSKDQLSVGVDVSVKHVEPTPKADIVTAIATFKGMTGIKQNLYAFDVELHDSAGKVGFGTHTRAIVHTDRFMQGAINRVKA